MSNVAFFVASRLAPAYPTAVAGTVGVRNRAVKPVQQQAQHQRSAISMLRNLLA
jgi:hypothetical protein